MATKKDELPTSYEKTRTKKAVISEVSLHVMLMLEAARYRQAQLEESEPLHVVEIETLREVIATLNRMHKKA